MSGKTLNLVWEVSVCTPNSLRKATLLNYVLFCHSLLDRVEVSTFLHFRLNGYYLPLPLRK